jgi:signal transduction histidine kinase
MSRPKSSVVFIGLLLLLLPSLAILQYRWIGEVSAAERGRLESSLRVASQQFAADFDGELARVNAAFQIRTGFPEDPKVVFERYQSWSEGSPYPHLIRSIGVARANPDGPPEFYRMDLRSGELQSESLPHELANLRDRFRPGPLNLSSSGETMMLFSPIFRGGNQFTGPRQDRPDRQDNFRPRNPEGRSRAPGGGPGPGGRMEGAALIELDRDTILKDLIPALVERHFSHDETDYRVAIAAGTDHPEVLYSSQGQWTADDIANPDAAVYLFGAPPRPPGGERPGDERRGGNRNRVPGPFLRGGGFQAAFMGSPWQLLAKHRLGSLETAVEQLRKRNMAISFGILLVLGAGLITVVIFSQRARTLGRLQMEFAAGVSHELRTPLAVIRSAAYNLRRGVVQDKEGVEQYAAIVQDEARRLSDMVDQVLLYSETQSGRKKYNLAPVDVNEVIDRAVTNLASTTDLEKCELTTDIHPELPSVQGDEAALTQCLQNLMSNALKYGKTNDIAQIEISAEKDPHSSEVRLSVTDHGPGIDPADQRHLFEAFYRGEKVGSNVPGNGLGLHLVKRIMQALNGRVTYSAAPNGGARFILHIPGAK